MAPYLRPALFALALLAGSGAAQAVTWSPVNAASGSFTINYKGADVTLTIAPAAGLINPLWYYNDNFNPQDPVSIGTGVEGQFGLPDGSLKKVSACDKDGCEGGGSVSGTNLSSFTSGGAFEYLAVHLGQGELFFHWAAAISGVTLTGVDSISNYRSYTTMATPLPAAAWMFGAALLGMLGLKRRAKRNAPSSMEPQVV
jgi:hypothetical protein